MTFLDRLNSAKCDFTQNQRGGKIIKFQQSQALTSHFESFWSIVHFTNEMARFRIPRLKHTPKQSLKTPAASSYIAKRKPTTLPRV